MVQSNQCTSERNVIEDTFDTVYLLKMAKVCKCRRHRIFCSSRPKPDKAVKIIHMGSTIVHRAVQCSLIDSAFESDSLGLLAVEVSMKASSSTCVHSIPQNTNNVPKITCADAQGIFEAFAACAMLVLIIIAG